MFYLASFKTPPPPTSRFKVNEDSLKRRLKARKVDHEDICEICGQLLGDLETARIIDEQFRSILHRDFTSDRNIVEGTNVTRNGLLLCSCCHTKFDKNVKVNNSAAAPIGRSIQIDEKGVIHLYGKAKEVNYKNLDGKKVPWVNLIDKDMLYPNSTTLKYALQLKVAGRNKRVRELNEDLEEEMLQAPKLKVKVRRSGYQEQRNCDISGCQRSVHIHDPDLDLFLCVEHAEIQEADIDR